ncbi:MAG: dihydropteroate synthase [Acidobacteriota bacterium]|nr:dihydropteroate synthase [Acidobacteriota bacterium]
MGIVNVTPDSFYPGSRTAGHEAAIARGRALLAQGCDIVDVGGESTRPGAESVEVADELERVIAVVAALSADAEVSIDTQKEQVARAAVGAGARIVNDVSGTLAEVAGELGAGYVAMHRQGDATTMQVNPTYDDVVAEVGDALDALARRARAAGVTRLWLDPGIGFGKSARHNLALLAHLERVAHVAARHDAGVLVGTSRKRFLGRLGGAELGVDDRLAGSVATAAWALTHGATMIRVHDGAISAQLRDLIARPLAEVAP